MTRETFILQYVIHNAATLLSNEMTTTSDLFDLAEKAANEAKNRNLFNIVEADGDLRHCTADHRAELVSSICAHIPTIITANPGVGYIRLRALIVEEFSCTQSVAKDAIVLAYTNGTIRKQDPENKNSPIVLT